MHRINTTSAGTGNSWVGSNQVLGTAATAFSPSYMQDQQENLCQFVESQGIELIEGDYEQLTSAINSGFGRKRNLNFNPTFALTNAWGGSQSVSTPVSVSAKLQVVGLYISTLSTISASDLAIYSDPDGLRISGTASGSGQTIVISQNYSALEDATYGNDSYTTAGETKKFTSSIKYKKVAGSNFVISSFIGSTSSNETIAKQVDGDSSSDSIGKAYRHTEVNTKDLGTTPISGVGFKITLASAGEFDIELKNLDLTEGFTVPDFQTYGNYTADSVFAERLSEAYTASGSIEQTVPCMFTGSVGDGPYAFVWKYKYTLPLENRTTASTDTVTITNIEATLNLADGSLTSATTINTVITKTSTKIVVEFEFRAAVGGTNDYKDNVNLSFDWTWHK